MQLPRIIFTIAIVITLFLAHFVPGPRIFHFPYNLFGLPIIALGFFLMLWSLKMLNAKKTTIHPSGTPTFLVTEGPYSFSRNPIYLGNFLLLFGGAFILQQITYFLAPAIFFLAINQIVIPYEEKKLKSIFGESFESYKNKASRWL